MRFKGILSTLAVAASVLVPAAIAQAGTTVKVVRGDLAATADGGTAKGYFRLSDVESGGNTFQRVTVLVRGLDAGDATDPQFDVVLDNGTTQADLGALHLFHSHTAGGFRFDTRTGTLPDGVTDLSGFSGGTLHITLDGADVATASIPAFVDPQGTAQDPSAPPAAISFGFGYSILGDTSTFGSAPVAKVTSFAVNAPSGVSQGIAVGALGLEKNATYTVVLTGATEDVLGTFTTAPWFGIGGFVVSTRHGGTIPGGSVGALAGRGVEIRDASGAVVLAGTMPSLN
jgi:hypothetical protein